MQAQGVSVTSTPSAPASIHTSVPVSLPVSHVNAPSGMPAQGSMPIPSLSMAQQAPSNKSAGHQIQGQTPVTQQTSMQAAVPTSSSGPKKNNNKRKRNTNPGNFSGNKNSIHGRMQTAASSVQRSLEKTCVVAERWCKMEPVSAKKTDSDKSAMISGNSSGGGMSHSALAPVSMNVDPSVEGSSSSSVDKDSRSEEEIFRAFQGAVNAATSELVALKRKLRSPRVENSMAIGFLANPVHFNEKCIGFKFAHGVNDNGPLGHRTKKVCDLLEELFVSGFTPHESSNGNIPKKQRTLKEVNKEKYSSYKFAKSNIKTENGDKSSNSIHGNVAPAPAQGNVTLAAVQGNITSAPAQGNIISATVQGNVAPSPAQGNIAPSPAQGNTASASGHGNVAPVAVQGNIAPASAQGNIALAPAQGNVASASGHGNVASVAVQGNIAPASAQGNVAPVAVQGNIASAPAQGNIAPASAQGNVAPTSAHGNVAPAPVHGNVSFDGSNT